MCIRDRHCIQQAFDQREGHIEDDKALDEAVCRRQDGLIHAEDGFQRHVVELYICLLYTSDHRQKEICRRGSRHSGSEHKGRCLAQRAGGAGAGRCRCPVSYTHLDVYKRQSAICAAAKNWPLPCRTSGINETQTKRHCRTQNRSGSA